MSRDEPRAAERRVGVTTAMADCLTEGRTAAKVTHALPALVAQRVLGIACGYPDANDADRLVHDAIQFEPRTTARL